MANTETDDDNSPCRLHALAPCLVCREKRQISRRTVYYTDGGTSYHWTKNCVWLEKGQSLVDKRGGIRSDIRLQFEDEIWAVTTATRDVNR